MSKYTIIFRSFAGIIGIIGILMIAPHIERLLIQDEMLKVIDEKEINVGALFYTEVDEDIMFNGVDK